MCTLTMISCSKDDANDNSSGTNANQMATIAQNGVWRITHFFDTDEDETSNFTGYQFSFRADGTLLATKGGTTVTGTWSIMDGSNSSSSSDEDFNIFFSVSDTSDFEDLNDDWDIISVSPTKIELIDISGGNGGTDFLTFEKS